MSDENEIASALSMQASMLCIGDCGIKRACELVQQIPDEVVSIADVAIPDVRDAWRLRDAGFNSFLASKSLFQICARDRAPPSAVIKAIKSKGSVKFGLGFQKGRDFR